jgi:hypothetical protein
MFLIGALIATVQVSGAPALEADPTSRARGCDAVLVDSPQSTERKGRFTPTFSATRILDLRLDTVIGATVQGSHLLQLKLYTPKGHLYQVLSVPFTVAAGDEARPAAKRWVDGYPEPLDEQRAKPIDHLGTARRGVSATLPVAGTSIMTNSLYGQWMVEPYLDDERCGAARTFVIGP